MRTGRYRYIGLLAFMRISLSKLRFSGKHGVWVLLFGKKRMDNT